MSSSIKIKIFKKDIQSLKLLYNYLQRSDCMIRIYTAPSCASCRKVKSWLNENQIPYVEKNIFSTLLKESELRELLERSENGTDDIISKRSKIIKENDIDIDSMKINDLIKFIQENPSVLKRPIMIDERRFQVGYNAEEIRVFIPKELRKLAECHDMDRCPQFSNKDCLNLKKNMKGIEKRNQAIRLILFRRQYEKNIKSYNDTYFNLFMFLSSNFIIYESFDY